MSIKRCTELKLSIARLASVMSVWKIFFSFKGRISRSTYWYAIAACIVVPCIYVLVLILREPVHPSGIDVFVLGMLLLAVYCRFPIAVKRWHDRNKLGWWVFIEWIPLIGPFWVIIECGCLKGTDGPNRFGSDPLNVQSGNSAGSSRLN